MSSLALLQRGKNKDQRLSLFGHSQVGEKVNLYDTLFNLDLSEAAFKAMDRNKDGYITKGELKLAKKKMSMKEVDATIKDYDLDNDGKLNYEEFLKSAQK